ncbi:aspartate:alanine exchanger family transporter [Bradyrhizobium sp. BR 10261]|uniref:aspartate:alanine exchanger family transporter n=1 Tax=Bradyrhizobium sp. BR 10261 TaxID=2749992 RepID=UPI001C645EB4|nr:transporter [Bradyrhizobium sp. BR 10261]MBW7967398.1 transporter [Bradyrhizobium sp. BR 10261]
MQGFFTFLQQNPYLLLFFTVGLAVWIGRASVKGYGLGMVAGAIVVGAGLSVWASTYGVKLELNNFAKSLFYYLFMYGVGLRVGPSFVNSLGGDGLKFTLLAVVSSVIGLTLVVVGAKLFDLPVGAAGGMLAGSQTMSAAIGSAEQAVTAGVVKLPAGMTPEAASGMIALSYGITYIWGTVGIILICKYLPRWWGVDARAAAKQYEKEFGVKDLEGGGLTGYRQFGLRAYRLENPATAGLSIAKFRTLNPEYRIVNVGRDGEPQGADPELVLQKGDIIALGGSTEHLTEKMGLIGPEVADARTLGIPMDQAEIVVFNKDVVGRTFESFRDTAIAGQLQVTKVERGGVQIPAGLKTQLQRMDIVSVVGLKGAVSELGEMWGRIARTNTSTDLLTLSAGMIVGFLIGMIQFPAFGAKIGLGNAGGLLLSGVLVSSIVSRLRFFGNTPNAARNVLEDLGLVVFVAIVGINAGAGLLSQLTGAVALKIFIVGFIACTIPPFIVWAIGYHIFKINPAVLMGGVAGARSHSGPCREAAVEIQSTVPWIGFPVGYAVSGILLTVFGYFAMILAQ